MVFGSCLWIYTRPRLYSATAELLVSRSAAPTEARLLLDIDLIHEAFAGLPEEVRRRGFGTRSTTLAKYPYTVNIPKDTDIVSIEVIARDPSAAAVFANEIVQADMQACLPCGQPERANRSTTDAGDRAV